MVFLYIFAHFITVCLVQDIYILLFVSAFRLLQYVILVEGGKKENQNLALTEKEHIQLYIDKGIDKKEALKMVAKERGVSKSSLYKYTIE